MTEQEIVRARRALMRRDRRLGALIKRVGPCELGTVRRANPFVGLARVILSQQLSTKAANTIFQRVVERAGGERWMTPARVRALDTATLRSVGVSGAKAVSLHDLSDHLLDGRLVLKSLAERSAEDVTEALTAVKGLGPWSAQMYLLFWLGHPDVWPVRDLGIVKGVQRLTAMKRPPKPRTLERVAKPWRPYRSVAAWYLWRLHELPPADVEAISKTIR